jgi:hypothetical protein
MKQRLVSYQSLNNSTNSTVLLAPEGCEWYLKQSATGPCSEPHTLSTSSLVRFLNVHFNIILLLSPLTPNDPFRGRTAPLTSKRCSLYIYSTNIGTEYFKHGIYCPFFPLQNAVCFIILTYLVPVLFTFHIQSVVKLKKKNSGAERLTPGRGTQSDFEAT